MVKTPYNSTGYLTENFTGVDELFISFYIKAASFPASSARIAQIQNSGMTVGTIFLSSSTQTFTTQATRFVFGATNSNAVDATFNDITLDTRRCRHHRAAAPAPQRRHPTHSHADEYADRHGDGDPRPKRAASV